MKVKATATKEIFHKDEFYIISFTPISPYPKELQLSSYLNFTSKGNLGWVTIGKQYELDIDFVESNQYGVTYKINSVPSMEKQSFENLSREESFEILRQCTSSDTIANNILDSYPLFIHKILTEGKESIDVSKIKGVGEAYLSAYDRELQNRYKYFSMLMSYSKYDLNVDECKKLYSIYETNEKIDKQFLEYPYNVLCVDLERSFGSVDKILKEERKDLISSTQRCTSCIMDILNRNEYDGNTRILGNDMFIVMRDDYNVSEILDMVVDVCKESPYIYYDEESKYIAKMSTYSAECNIAQFVQTKLESSQYNKWDYIDTSKYKVVDGFEMTDEQLSLLDNVCNNDISLLCGSAGCVDAETEFFDGKQWKSIADYQQGDMVLQYNFKSNKSEMVYPYSYIDKECDLFYTIQTKNTNQVLSEDHIVTVMENNRIMYYPITTLFDKSYMLDKLKIYLPYITNENAVKYDRLTEDNLGIFKPKTTHRKYCFRVPSENLVLRRRGQMFITHNCGKTSCIKGLIEMLDDNNKSYTLLSFSGKASLVLANQTNRNASTIHLKCLRDGEIDSDVILIDEFTMTSLDTFSMLLSCVTNENAKFVFVGDVAQLPAISLGKLFKDMLDNNFIPTTMLTKIFRYTSNGALYSATNT